jgi:hypothetical protein
MNLFLKRITNTPPSSHPVLTRRAMIGAALIAGSLMLSACGGDNPSVAPPSADTQSKASPTSAPSTDVNANGQSPA